MRHGSGAFDMQIQINGEIKELPEQSTVADMLTLLSVTGRRVAVELNQEIVPKSQHGATVLKAGDKVEVVHAIGGG